MDELVASLTEALRYHDGSKTRVVKREGFAYDSPQPGVLEWMPAMSGGRAMVKVVAYNPENPSRHRLPTIVSTINVFDVATGRLMALMDGVLPTALRTGAASAIATQILARSARCVVGLVGCGAQAVTQLHGITRVRDV
jgi:ornithine cyclodeaminase/alanine dehydrogenase-like protein (mu-crystallin family)